MECHSSTSAIQEHVKKCTILDDPEKKINPYWSILSNQQLVIISRYLIEEEEEEEEEEEDEDEELVGEERDVEALALKTEKDPLFNQNINNLLKVSESFHTFVRVPQNKKVIGTSRNVLSLIGHILLM